MIVELILLCALVSLHLCGSFVLIRSLWSRHKKKVFVTLGIAGSGYLLYKLYDAHKRRLDEVAMELAAEREHDERIKAQLRFFFFLFLC